MSDRAATPLSDALQSGDVLCERCPSRVILNHITSKWGVLTLLALRSGTLRFSALRRTVSGVSERMLAQTLQQLEACHLVDRRSYAEVPPRVEYSLTPLGREAAERVGALADWVEASLPALLDQSATAA